MRTQDTWTWAPYTSKNLPAGCKKLAKPSKPTPGSAPDGNGKGSLSSLTVSGTATFAGAAIFNNVITATKGIMTKGFIYQAKLLTIPMLSDPLALPADHLCPRVTG